MNSINNISSLDRLVIDRIYHFIDRKVGRLALGLTCKTFYSIFGENKKYMKLAKYVQRCLTVCATNMPHLPLWNTLKDAMVILIGEQHINLLHRKIFAEFLHKIWNKEIFFLLTEDFWELRTEQLEYVKADIEGAYRSWDLDSTNDELVDLVKALKLPQMVLRWRNSNDRTKRFDQLKELWEYVETFRKDPQDGAVKEVLQLMTKLLSKTENVSTS